MKYLHSRRSFRQGKSLVGRSGQRVHVLQAPISTVVNKGGTVVLHMVIQDTLGAVHHTSPRKLRKWLAK